MERFGYFQCQAFTAISAGQVKWKRLLSPTRSPVAQVQDVLKTADLFVCLDTTPPPSPPIPCQLPKWTQPCKRREYWCGKSPFLFLFFCPPVILSFSLFLCLPPSYCLCLSLSLYCILSRFSPRHILALSVGRVALSFLNLLLHDHPRALSYIWIFAFLCVSAHTRVCLASLLKSG